MSSTESKFPCLTFTHHWTLDNFAHLYDEACQWKWEVESEVFTVPGNEDLKLRLSVIPKRRGTDGEAYLWMVLCTEAIPDGLKGKVTLKNRRGIVNEEGKELWGKVYLERQVLQKVGLFDLAFLPVEKVHHSTEGYLKEGTLRVLCEMTLHSPEAIFTLPSNTHLFSHTCIPSSVSSFSHSLTLSHFKWLCEDSTRQMPLKVESGYFAPQRSDIGQIKIQFYPKGRKGSDEEKVEIAIFSENKASLRVHVECALLSADGDKCHTFEATYEMLPNSGITHSVPRWNLLSLLDSLPADKLTLKCNVTVMVEGEQEKVTTPTISTHLDLALFTFHYVSFTWTIERFLAQRHCIDSSIFTLSTDSRYTFHLRLYPSGEPENVTLSLCFLSPSFLEESKVYCSNSVVDTKGDEWNAGIRTTSFSEPAEFGPHKLMPCQAFDNFAWLFLPEDKLTIKCELWIHEPRKELPPELLNPPSANDSCWNDGCSVFCGWLVSCFG